MNFPALLQDSDWSTLRSILVWLIKGTVSLTVFYLLFSKILEADLRIEIWPSGMLLWIIVLVGLMLINVGFEAWKWQIATDERISIIQSLKIVLKGQALNWILPFSSGEFASRIGHSRKKKSAFLASFLLSGMSLFVTILMGLIGILFYYEIPNLETYMIGTLSLCLVLLLALFFLHKKYGKLAFVTLSRFVVFSIQFVLILKIFNPSLMLIATFAGVGWIFLFRTFIPGLFGKLGVREASAIAFFEPLVSNSALILVPCLIIWLVNQAVPSLAGGLLILSTKAR